MPIFRIIRMVCLLNQLKTKEVLGWGYFAEYYLVEISFEKASFFSIVIFYASKIILAQLEGIYPVAQFNKIYLW